MDVVDVPPSDVGSQSPTRSGGGSWWVPALAGAAAFWLANFVISLTPVAAGYRSASSIAYLPMLVEAAVGGMVVAVAVAVPLVRYPQRIPGAGPLTKALRLGLCALVVLTVVVEVPSKLGSEVTDPGHWLLVATAFNTIRVLALAMAVGLVARGRESRNEHRGGRGPES